MTVPNQRIVKIEPRIKRNANNLFAMINIDALSQAVTKLNGSALKLWLYLNKNQDHFKCELSQKACQQWGIKKDSYYNGFEELVKKGFLVQEVNGSNIYRFYENPTSANSENTIWFSEKYETISEIQNKKSEIPERNNTNNTVIKQNKTILPLKKESYRYFSDDFSDKEQINESPKYSDERFGDASKEMIVKMKALDF